ncbi:TetR/AcrR family transcriptional regulator [Kribbella sp. NPDC058245]|uniref:TetR/AcrR family transcriptional regulator n=1 Tax=Kribbella sp. NPDC058245 TaxID=3346399 RepID=UPI0036E62F6B
MANGRRSNAERTATTRGEILSAAIDAFGTRGFHKASLQEIAAAAGVTPAGLLHHFGSKNQLLTELLAHRDSSEIAEVNDPERPYGTDFLDHLAITAERNSQRRGVTQLYAVLSAEGVTEDHPAQDYFRARYDGLRRMIADEIRTAQTAGDLPTGPDPVRVATLVIAAMDGLQVQWLYDPEAVDMGGLIRDLITALTRP